MALIKKTSLITLMQYASKLGKAKISGDEERIIEAQANLNAYEKLVLESDELVTHMTNKDLYG